MYICVDIPLKPDNSSSMGRYTTVQAYSDSNPKVTKVSYEQATQGATGETTVSAESSSGKVMPPPRPKTEKVDNVMGSTAGAGSGEFHMYRAARRRELDRVAKIEADALKQEQQDKFESTITGKRAVLEAATQKRAEKRRKRKDAAKRHKTSNVNGVQGDESNGSDTAVDESEFTYEPVSLTLRRPVVEIAGKSVAIVNDGSFLAQMKALTEESKSSSAGAIEAA